MLRTIIVDDEPSALNVLAILLKRHCTDDVVIVGSSTSPSAGKMLIEEMQPDLVFMDIEMPGISGIDLVREFVDPAFRVVFVTAYDAYAIEAFRVSAIDYLLKPIAVEDVIRTVEKVKHDIRKKDSPMIEQLKQLERAMRHQTKEQDKKIGVAMADKIVFLNIPEILYCEAQGAYTHIHLHAGRKLTASKTLGDFESQLATHSFFRIHHSYLINLNRVCEFQRFDGGYVMMEDNVRLEVSTRKRKEFLSVIGGMLM
jgi:two-component system, LytTR family, response regulator